MEKFWGKVDKTSSCWNWVAGKRHGYGAFKFRGRTDGAHRVSYILSKGEIPEGLFVCHTCDNRACVNPDHLFLGTQSDNMCDCRDKGRIVVPIGTQFKLNHKALNASLRGPEIQIIKQAIATRGEMSLKQLSSKLGVKYQLLRDINCGRIYRG